VASGALGGEAGLGVIGFGGPGVVGFMAPIAIGGNRLEVAIDVALRAGNRGMRAGQGED
jgi:hypothetical protein